MTGRDDDHPRRHPAGAPRPPGDDRGAPPPPDEAETIGWDADSEDDGEDEASETVPLFPSPGLPHRARSGSSTDIDTASLPTGSTWGRYSIESHLGQGGMGVVYRAHDPTLDRHVALKFIRNADPSLIQRFFREARAQARVEHDNVCKVFEAGEQDGEPFIAMQFVPGVELGEAAVGLPLDALLELLRKVALAVHAAHRRGLIHRDLKPGNILVETTDDGVLKPYVMDFGLVRDERDTRKSHSGVILGTPHYMAPEQAMGDLARIDRRTDVFALGALLFRLLSGRPAIEATNALMYAARVVSEDAPPLQSVAPSVPADVAAIAGRCLARDPTERYPSARALADDLQRYLDGDPVEARPLRWLPRLLRRARKHRTLVTVSAVALVAVLALAGVAVQAQLHAARQTRLAVRFGEETRQLEYLLRVARMAPLHDVRPRMREVRARIEEIERQTAAIGRPAEGPGYYAIGRAELALGEHGAARAHLQRAWDSGYRAPDVALALGIALGHLYEAALAELTGVAERDVRERQRRQIERELREPAAHYIAQGRDSTLVDPQYALGLLALYEGDTAEALRRAAEVASQAPELYEAPLLAGEAQMAIGADAQRSGDLDGAIAAYERAATEFAAAVQIAPSDAGARERECVAWTWVLDAERLRPGPVDRAGPSALAACAAARTADPERASAWLHTAAVHRMLAERLRLDGGSPLPALANSAHAARRAVQVDGTSAASYEAIGLARLGAATYAMDHGRTADRDLEEAIRAFTFATTVDPRRSRSFEALGAAQRARALQAWYGGGAPRPAWTAARAATLRAIELRPVPSSFLLLGQVLQDRALYADERGFDARRALATAAQAYRVAIRLDPDHFFEHPTARTLLALTLVNHADLELARGRDPRATLDRARAPLDEATEALPDLADPHLVMGWCEQTRAAYEVRAGLDPRGTLDRARAHLAEALRRDETYVETYNALARVELIAAEDAAARGGDVEAALTAAESWIDQGLARHDGFAELLQARGEVELGRALHTGADGAEVRRALARAERALEQARSAVPDDARGLLLLARVHAARAPTLPAGERDAVLRRGIELATSSATIDARPAEVWLVLGELQARRYGGLSAGEERDAAGRAAREALERAVRIDPRSETRAAPWTETLAGS